MDAGESSRRIGSDEDLRSDVQRIDESDVASSREFQKACEIFDMSVSERARSVLAYWTRASRYSRPCTLDMLSHYAPGLPYMSIFCALLEDDSSQVVLSLSLFSEQDESEDLMDVQYWLANTFDTERLSDDIHAASERLTTLKAVGAIAVPDCVSDLLNFLVERSGQNRIGNIKPNRHKVFDTSQPIDADLLDDITRSQVYATFKSMYQNFCSGRLLKTLNFASAISKFSKAYFLRTLTADHLVCLLYYHAISEAEVSTFVLVLGIAKRFEPRFELRDMAIWLRCHFDLPSEDLRPGRNFFEELATKGAVKVPKYFQQLASIFSLMQDVAKKPNTPVSRWGRSSVQTCIPAESLPSDSKSSDETFFAQSSPDSLPKTPPSAPAISPLAVEDRTPPDTTSSSHNWIQENGTADVESKGETKTTARTKPSAPPKAKSSLRLHEKKQPLKSTSCRTEDTNKPNSSNSSPETVITNTPPAEKTKQPKAPLTTTNLSPEVELRPITSQKLPPDVQIRPVKTVSFQNGISQVSNLTASVTIQKVSVANSPEAGIPSQESLPVSPRMRKLNSSRSSPSNQKNPVVKELTLLRGDQILKEAIKKCEEYPLLSPPKPTIKVSQKVSSTTPSAPLPDEPRSTTPKTSKAVLSEASSASILSKPSTSTQQKVVLRDEADSQLLPEVEDDSVVLEKVSSTTTNNPPNEAVPTSCRASNPVTSNPITSNPSTSNPVTSNPVTSTPLPPQPSTSSSRQKELHNKSSQRDHHKRSDYIPRHHRILLSKSRGNFFLESGHRWWTVFEQKDREKRLVWDSAFFGMEFGWRRNTGRCRWFRGLQIEEVGVFKVSTKRHKEKLTVEASEDSKIKMKTYDSTSETKSEKRSKHEKRPNAQKSPDAQEPSRIPTPSEIPAGKSSSEKTKATPKSSKSHKKSSKKNSSSERKKTSSEKKNSSSERKKTSTEDLEKKNAKKNDKDDRVDYPINADEAEEVLARLMDCSFDEQFYSNVSEETIYVQPSSPLMKPATPQTKPSKSKPLGSPSRASSKTSALPLESSKPVVNPQEKKDKSKSSSKTPHKASIEQICQALSASLAESENSSSERKKTSSEKHQSKSEKHKSKHGSSSSSREREKSRDSRKSSSSSSRKSSKKEDKRRSPGTERKEEVQSTSVELIDKTEASISISNKVDISSLRANTPVEKTPSKFKRKNSGSPSTCQPSTKASSECVAQPPASPQLPQTSSNQNSTETQSNPPSSDAIGPKVMVEPVNGAPHPVSLESEVTERLENSFNNAGDIDDNMDLVNVTEGSEVVIYETLPDQPTLQQTQEALASGVVQQVPDSSTKEIVKRLEADSSVVHPESKLEVITVPHDSATASCTSSFLVSNLSSDDTSGQIYPVVGQPESWPPGYKAVMALQDSSEVHQGNQVECPVTFSADTANEVLQQIKEATVIPASMVCETEGIPEDAETVNYLLIDSQSDKEQLLKICMRAERRKHIFLKEYKPEDDTYEILGISDNDNGQLEYVQEVQETVLEEISIVTERMSEENAEGARSGNGKRQSSSPPSFQGQHSAKRPRLEEQDQNFDETNCGRTNTKRRPRAPRVDNAVSRDSVPDPKNCFLQSVDEQLIEAAKEGNIRKIKRCLESGANVNASDNYRRTSLHYAVQSESLDAANCLVEKGAFVEAVDLNLSTPLHMAAKRGYSKILKALLANGARLDARERWGRTPLHFAASLGHASVVTHLLLKGANPLQKDDDGLTCYDYARDNGHTNILALLESYNMNYVPHNST